MLDTQLIKDIVLNYLENTEYDLIDVTVSNDNRICVEIDKFDGVDVDFCASLNRYIESNCNRDIEDYELEVGSSGITSPFKTLMQYKKNIGNSIEVVTNDGQKYLGVLVEVNDENFTIEYKKKVVVEGKKRKVLKTLNTTFAYGDIKYAKYDLKI